MGVSRKFLNWYAKLAPARGYVPPPYEHVVQIGDPRLRKISETVPLDKIKTKEIQTVIQKLEYVLYKYGSVGMSAPQIGVNLRIIAMRHTSKQISQTAKESALHRGMTEVPFTVFINPQLKVVDYKKVIHTEGCESIRGFSADVPRYKEVQLTGLNQQGETTSRTFKDWAARIAQHEMDHLDGKLYTDIMDRKSLSCTCWEEVNLSQGRVVLPFTPE
ncbi:peptide deformylase, mitochondrial-like [Pectinophora gossypiella]|uniref:peptide deformylase, mitochondrial-like n=1 Tax=Pectinophora gossypiella TaxID=13191 RepID=UPI00214E9A27|nr:peptide deformylase, mitochondrial-like [Pectinophora gossypiella]